MPFCEKNIVGVVVKEDTIARVFLAVKIVMLNEFLTVILYRVLKTVALLPYFFHENVHSLRSCTSMTICYLKTTAVE